MQRGQIFAGKYQIVGPLGKGGMGTVYEAIVLPSQESVALKLITGVEISSEVLLRFIREAESTERINSPNVVRIFDLGSDLDTGVPYMAMEKLTGLDVSHVLRGLGALPPNTAAKIAAQAAVGLACAHEIGVVHRDIKPGNLFLSEAEDGSGEVTVKVLDFGIAKLSQDMQQDREELTQTGSVLGSPHYMSPEQAQGLKNIDFRTDIWSLGVVLYKMLCGKAPHAEYESLGQIIVAVCGKPATPVQELAPWVPPQLSLIVERCLRIDPAERFASTSELVDALVTYLGPDQRLFGEDVRAVDDNDRMYVAPRAQMPSYATLEPGSLSTQHSLEVSSTNVGAPRSSPRSPVWLAAFGGAALAAAAAGLFFYVQGQKPIDMPMATLEEEPSGGAQPTDTNEPSLLIELQDVVLHVEASPIAQVFVDSVKVDLVDGALTLTGAPGSEHIVRVVDGSQDLSENVAITASGARPSRISVPQPASSSHLAPARTTRPANVPANHVPTAAPRPVPAQPTAPQTGAVKTPPAPKPSTNSTKLKPTDTFE